MNIFVCFVVFVKLMWVSLLWYNSSLQYNCSFCKFCCENIDLDMVYFMLESYDIYSDLNGLCDIGKIWKNWYQFFLTGNHPENKCFIQIFFLLFTSVILSTDVKTFNVCFLHRAQCNNRCKNLIYYIGHDFHRCNMLRQFSKKNIVFIFHIRYIL